MTFFLERFPWSRLKFNLVPSPSSCCLPYFSKVTRNPGSSGPLSQAIVYRAEYKRALFRASRQMVLLKPYLELKGPMKFACFLSPPLRQFLSGINLESRGLPTAILNQYSSLSLFPLSSWICKYSVFCVFYDSIIGLFYN